MNENLTCAVNIYFSKRFYATFQWDIFAVKLCGWTFTFHKVVWLQFVAEAADFVSVYSAVHECRRERIIQIRPHLPKLFHF